MVSAVIAHNVESVPKVSSNAACLSAPPILTGLHHFCSYEDPHLFTVEVNAFSQKFAEATNCTPPSVTITVNIVSPGPITAPPCNSRAANNSAVQIDKRGASAPLFHGICNRGYASYSEKKRTFIPAAEALPSERNVRRCPGSRTLHYPKYPSRSVRPLSRKNSSPQPLLPECVL
jgi:hypothetical protein